MSKSEVEIPIRWFIGNPNPTLNHELHGNLSSRIINELNEVDCVGRDGKTPIGKFNLVEVRADCKDLIWKNRIECSYQFTLYRGLGKGAPRLYVEHIDSRVMKRRQILVRRVHKNLVGRFKDVGPH